MDQAASGNWPSGMKSLFERIQDEACMCCAADPPANDTAREDINDEGDIDKPCPGRDIGEIRNPEAVRSRCPEVPVHLVTRAWRGCVWHGRTHLLAASNTLKALILHQPFDRAACHIKAFALHLPPDFLGPVDGVVLIEHPLDLRPQDGIALDTWRGCLGMVTLCDVVVICRWGNRQNSANRLDPIDISVVVDERNHRLNGRSSISGIARSNAATPSILCEIC
jgi:hypothetical protein